jgi:hypothetical protein
MLKNSYVRAAIVSIGILVLVASRMPKHYGKDWASRHALIVFCFLTFALCISTALIGTFARKSEQPWSWLKLIAMSFGCWLAVLYLIVLAQNLTYRH